MAECLQDCKRPRAGEKQQAGVHRAFRCQATYTGSSSKRSSGQKAADLPRTNNCEQLSPELQALYCSSCSNSPLTCATVRGGLRQPECCAGAPCKQRKLVVSGAKAHPADQPVARGGRASCCAGLVISELRARLHVPPDAQDTRFQTLGQQCADVWPEIEQVRRRQQAAWLGTSNLSLRPLQAVCIRQL